MSRIKINNGSWQYANTADIPQRGIDYWNQADQQAAFDYADAEINAVSENVTFTLISSDNEDIMGLTVVFSDITEDTTEEFVWEGSPITVVVTEGHQYKFSCDGSSKLHGTAETTTYTAVASNNRDVLLTLERIPATDLSMYDIYGNEIAQTTANCYVIKEAGQYKFPLVYGNALKEGATNAASYTNNGGSYSHDFVAHDGTVITTPYIENLVGNASSVQLSIADTDGIFTNISIIDGSPCRYVQFEVANVPTTGANGIISVKNSSGTIMWNWHIWVWSDDLTSVEVTNSTSVKYKLLPYNLGSKWDDDTKTYIKNWHYQFGRPTPFVCPSAYNSETDHATYGTLSFSIANVTSNIQKGIQNPATFYKQGSRSENFNWFYTNSGKTYNLWDAGCTVTGASDNDVVKTVYDPSPVGFKMPNGNTFTGFSIISNANGIVKFTRYSGDTTGIGIPMSGNRDSWNGSLYRVGSIGCVWPSSADSQYYAQYLFFHSSNVSAQDFGIRADGMSVRPVEE